jgi:hypothetical protein
MARIAPQRLYGQVHGFQGVRPIASMSSASLSQILAVTAGTGDALAEWERANLSDRGDDSLIIVVQRLTSSGYPLEAG